MHHLCSHPQSSGWAWLASQKQWTVAGRRVLSFFTRVLLFCQTCCLWEPSATENSISQAPCKSRALCPALRRMQRCGSHHPHRQSQSVTWMGDTQQNCEGRRKLSREPVNSSSPVLGKFFPSPDTGFLFCVVETSGPMITSFRSCFETSILSARWRNGCCRLSQRKETWAEPWRLG